MKTLKSLLLVAVAAVTFISCSQNDSDGYLYDDSFSIIVDNPDVTEVNRTIQGRDPEQVFTMWLNGDKMLLRSDVGKNTHLLINDGDDSLKTASFSGRGSILEELNDCNSFSAIYTDLFIEYSDCNNAVFMFRNNTSAFAAGSRMKNDALVSKLVYRNQKYSGPIQLTMKRITSVVKVMVSDKTTNKLLANDNILKLYLNSKTEKISGTLKYDFKTGTSDKSFVKQFSDNNLKVNINKDAMLKVDGDPVYFCMIPAEIEQDSPLMIYMFSKAGYEINKTITTPMTFEEGSITTLKIDVTDNDIIIKP